MAKQGRKNAVSPEDILTILLENDFEILNNNEQIKRKKDKIWEQISEALDNRMKPVTLYFYIFQNRHDVYLKYRKAIGLAVDNIQKIQTMHSNTFEKDESIDKSPEKKNIKKSKQLIFDIEIEGEEWDSMKPIEHQKGNVLQSGWTYIISKIIWKYQELPCCFNFKHAIVRKDSRPLITINGYCSECGAVLIAESENCPSDTKVCFQVKTKNSHGIPHTKKRRLAGIELEKLMKDLETKKPKEVRRDIAAKEMVHGCPEPAHVYTLSALSKARQKAKDKKLGIVTGISVWDSLSLIKENVEFNKFIKDIGYDKFHITYWSPEQTNLYNDIQKYLGTPVSIDSTGSMVTSISRPNGESSEIFLHELVTHIDHLIIPVTQTMTAFIDPLFKLCMEFPAWTNVMQDYFQSPHDVTTSARSEAYFSDAKGSL